jgi:hypothetical protein
VNQLRAAAIRVLTGLPAGLQADDAPHNSGPDFGKASPFGLLVVVLLLVGVMFLLRSMNRHLKNLPDSFDTQNPALGKAPDQAVDSDAQALSDTQAPSDGTIGKAGVDQPMQGHPDERLPDEPDG